MSWFKNVAPALPEGVVLKEGKLTWKSPLTKTIRAWTLYQQNVSNWKLVQILDVATTTITVQPGTYALCSVDELANESAGVIFSLA
jgi:hypothetical protein